MTTESELLTRARECTRGGETPIVAWLDGYAAGHSDATKSAAEILGCPFIPGEPPAGLVLLPPIDDGPEDNYGGF